MILNSRLINPEVRIETTNKCNAKCVICPRKLLTRPLQTMDTGFFLDLLFQVNDLGAKMISPFGYGEPLLDPELDKKIGYCSSLGLKTFITTNASMLDPDLVIRLLDAGLSKIRFSFHGVTQEQYEKAHGLNYQNVRRNIINFQCINKIKYANSCKIEITTIGTKEEIPLIKAQWPEVDLLEVWKPHNWAGGKNYREIKRAKRTCNRPFRGPLQILVDGSLVICCFDFNGQMVIGNAHEKSIIEILKGKSFAKIRKAHEVGNMEGLLCENCDQLNIEQENPLLYSSIGNLKINQTAGIKFDLEAE